MRPDYTKKIVEESLKFDIFNRGKKEVSIEYNRENCEVNYKFYHDRIPYMREPVTLDGIEFFSEKQNSFSNGMVRKRKRNGLFAENEWEAAKRPFVY